MAFSDPVFEKRRATFGGSSQGSTQKTTNSGSSFVDPVFEKRRMEIIKTPSQPTKKQITAPVTLSQPKKQNLVERTTDNLAWAGNTALDNAASLVKKIGNFTVKLVTPKPTAMQQEVAKLTQTPIKLSPDQKKLTTEQLQQVAVPSASLKQQSKQESLKKAQEIRKTTSEKIRALEKVFDSQVVKQREVKKGYKEPGIFGDAVEALSQGIVNTMGIIGAGVEKLGRQAKPNPYDIQGITNKFLMTNVGRKLSAEADNIIASNPEWNPDPKAKPYEAKSIARLWAATAPSILINIAATLATYPVGGVGGYVTGYLMESGATYKEAKKMGVSEEKAQLYGDIVGVVNSIFEHLLPGSMTYGKKIVKGMFMSGAKEVVEQGVKETTKKSVDIISKSLAKEVLKNLGKFGLKMAKNGAIEGGTEAIQEMWANVIAMNYDKNRKYYDNAFTSAIGGFLGGATFGGGSEEAIQQSGIIPDGTYTPEQVIGKLIQTKMNETTEGKELMKTALQAKETGQQIEVKNDAIVNSEVQTINQEEVKSVEKESGKQSSASSLQKEIDQILGVDESIKNIVKKDGVRGKSYLAMQKAADAGDKQVMANIDRIVELQTKIDDLQETKRKNTKAKKKTINKKQSAKEYIEKTVKERTTKFRISKEEQQNIDQEADVLQQLLAKDEVNTRLFHDAKSVNPIENFEDMEYIVRRIGQGKATMEDISAGFAILEQNGYTPGLIKAMVTADAYIKNKKGPRFREETDQNKQLEELLAIERPNLEQIKLINKLRAEQMAQKQAKSAEDIGEEKMGWKDGRKDEFDNAVDLKNVDKVREMLPEVPAYYKEEFKGKIDEAIRMGELMQEAEKYKTAEEFIKAQKLVYHGTTANLKEFSNDTGTFFTDDYMNADGYASGENVYEGYIRFINPLIIDAKGRMHNDIDTEYGKTTREVVANVDSKKYDGIIFENIKDSWIDDAEAQDPSTIYYAFRPKDSFLNESQLEEIWNEANKSDTTGPRFRETSAIESLNNEAKKYKNVEDFIESQSNFRDGHTAPSFDDTPVKQRMEDGGDFNLSEVIKGQHTQPSDYFDPTVGPKYYMYDDKAGMESLTAINNVKRGAKTITAYRAIPKEINADKLIDGDWISFSRTYAENHGLSRFGENEYKIIEQDVNPKEVWWDGNDIREWGYDTGKTNRLSRYDLINIWNKANLKLRVKDDVKKITGRTITDAQEQELIDLNRKFFGDDKVNITLQIMANSKALGQYYQNMIDIVDGQADPKATYLHEAVHKYLDVFSTTEEYVQVLEEGAKKYKTDDYAEVEEKIAEEFITYAKTKESANTGIKGFFTKILNRIKLYFANKSAIERLYNEIIEGKAAKKAETATDSKPLAADAIPSNEQAQTPVGAGKKAKSKAYTRVYDMLAEETKQDVSYNKLNIEKDVDAAAEFAAADPKAAIRVALGLEEAPKGQTETAISILLADKAGRDGDFQLQSQLEAARSLRQTRRGQEIVSERGRFNEDSPHFFIRKLLDARLNNLGKSLGVAIEEYRLRLVSAKEVAIKKIDKVKKNITEKIKADRKKIDFAKDFLSSITCK
jgi:hypothetical protein